MFGKSKNKLKNEAETAEVNSSAGREVINQADQSYGAIVKRQFKKNRPAVWSLRVIYLIIILGLSADFIANEKPIFCKYKGKTHFPILKSYAVDLGLAKWPKDLANVQWKSLNYDKVVYPPIPYSPTTLDFLNAQFKPPSKSKQNIKSGFWKHRMGTDDLGRDVASGMIHGARVAMLVGIISMGISTIIGIIMGALSGYFGDSKLKTSRIRIILNLIAVPIAFFYAGAVGGAMSIPVFIGIMLAANVLVMLLKKIPALGKKVNLPVDILIMRLIEILRSVPRLLLILAIVAIIRPSIYIVMIIIGLTSWTGICRFIRGELLRVRSLEYIEAAESLGYSRFRIVMKHALPNAISSALIAIAFGVAAAILIESSLSFLGIGIPPEQITWGKLLSIGRKAPEAWWLAIFPGFAIFVTVTVFNLLGDGLAEAIDPKLKQ